MSDCRKLFFLLALSGVVIACNDDPMGDCEIDFDCVDEFDCTSDVCGVGGVCRNTPVDAMCPTGQQCVAGMGCVEGGACTSNEACDDSIACTSDVCAVGGECMNTPIDSMCDTGEICDAMMGCVTDTGCESAAECDDSIACTNDVCGADRTCQNTPVAEMCDTSMMEQCVPGVGCQVIIPCTEDSECQDGDFCNGAEVCNTEFGCEPPAAIRVCNDSDDCTMDRCDATVMGTDGQMGACVFECDSTMPACGCSPGATCNGNFSLPGAAGACLGGPPFGFDWDFTNVTFTNTAGVIQVTGWRVGTTATLPNMADPGPACPNVNAVTGLPASGGGSCAEEYRIMGTFTDDNTFVGMFTATFDNFCVSCNQTTMVTGTRI